MLAVLPHAYIVIKVFSLGLADVRNKLDKMVPIVRIEGSNCNKLTWLLSQLEKC